jgi:hypothetical protein
MSVAREFYPSRPEPGWTESLSEQLRMGREAISRSRRLLALLDALLAGGAKLPQTRVETQDQQPGPPEFGAPGGRFC